MGKKILVISDIHAGNSLRQPNIDKCLKLLKTMECDHIILLGDIIDFQAYKENKWSSNNVTELFEFIRTNKDKITYVVGNHDLFIKDLRPIINLKIVDRVVIGDTVFVHGHQFDKRSKGLSILMDILDYLLLILKQLGLAYVFDFFKRIVIRHKLTAAQKNIASYAKANNCKRVIFGHYHLLWRSEQDGIELYNTGDWITENSYLLITDNKVEKYVYIN